MKKLVFGLLFALTVGIVTAAPPEVPAKLEVKAGKIKEIVVKPSGDKEVAYRVVGGDNAFTEVKPKKNGDRVFWLIPETDAPIYITWWTVGEGESSLTEVNRGAPTPTPTPGPGPTPGPTPTPASENPFGAAPGAKLLIVTESEDNSKLPLNQFLITNGTVFRKYLDENFGEGNYFILDQNVTINDQEKLKPFKTAIGRPDHKGKVPWLYVGKESSGLSVALPADVEAAKAKINPIIGKTKTK